MEDNTDADSVSLPSISNLPYPRNPDFVGRDQSLADLLRGFDSSDPAQHTQVIFGLAGVGKSQLALEYAYRNAGRYNIIWWMHAEEPAALGASFVALAAALGKHLPKDASIQSVCRAVLYALSNRNDWLLIFDNAAGPAGLEEFLPTKRNGHVLITSRNPSWRGAAESLPLRGLARQDSVALLRKRIGYPEDDEPVEKLAKALDDLPLALDQAASLMQQTGMSCSDYLVGYEDQWGRMLAEKRTQAEYPNSAAMTWELSVRELERSGTDAINLLNLCAFLAPDDISRTFLRMLAPSLPAPVGPALNNILQFEVTVKTLQRLSLIDIADKSLSLHRVGAQMTRDRMPAEFRRQWSRMTLEAVASLFQFDSHDLSTWIICADILPHALAVAQHAEETEAFPDRTATLLNEVGRYLHKRSQLAQAKNALERSHALSTRIYGPDHPKLATVSNNLGRVMSDLGEQQEALRLFQQSMQIDQATYSHDDPHVATVINNYAKTLFATGDVDTARKQFEWALSVYEQHYGADHPKIAAVINNLGYVLRHQGDPQAAIKHFDRALNMVETRYGQQHPHVATVYHNLGLAFRDLGDFGKSRQHLERALAIDESVYGSAHPSVIRDLDQLAHVLQLQEETIDARQVMERSLRAAESLNGPNHPSLAPRLRNLGYLLKTLGDLEGSRELLERASRIPSHASSPSSSSSTLASA